MNNNFTFKAKVWKWPGDMPWHFVSLDQEMSKAIREKYPKASMIKVEATVEATLGRSRSDRPRVAWSTSIFRNNRDKNYLLPIKKDIRKKANIQDGEAVEISMEI